jgi:hypothetical protein
LNRWSKPSVDAAFFAVMVGFSVWIYISVH